MDQGSRQLLAATVVALSEEVRAGTCYRRGERKREHQADLLMLAIVEPTLAG